jgi:taurine dioxygenase
LNVNHLTPHIGAEITGLDLSRGLGRSTAAELLRVLDACGVVIMRGQQLTAENFVAFGRNLGELSAHPLEKFAKPDFPELLIDSNIFENGEPIGRADAGQRWRIDGAHLKTPYRATVLYAVEIPVKDGIPLGATRFASTAAAYDALEPALRQQLQGIRAVHIHGAGRKKRSTPYFPDSGLTQGFQRGVEHPVVRTHPHSGRKCLYVNPLTTSHIRGMNDQDSAALLDQLYQHMARPEFVYRLPWQVGDVVVWDNVSTQYCTEGDYALPLRRLLYRAWVKGAAGR